MAFNTCTLTGSRAERVAAMPPVTDIAFFTGGTRAAVSSIVDIPNGYKITKLIFGDQSGTITNTRIFTIHTADAATGKSGLGVNAPGVNPSIEIEGWFDDLWVSVAGGTPSCWIEVQCKPAKG